jgi:hypothetical protein
MSFLINIATERKISKTNSTKKTTSTKTHRRDSDQNNVLATKPHSTTAGILQIKNLTWLCLKHFQTFSVQMQGASNTDGSSSSRLQPCANIICSMATALFLSLEGIAVTRSLLLLWARAQGNAFNVLVSRFILFRKEGSLC